MSPSTSVPDNPHRLPRTVVPHRYQIEIAPDLEVFTFRGAETIDVEISEPVDEVVLNAIEIEITDAALIAGDRRIPASVSYDEEMQRATLTLHETAPVGSGSVEIEFEGMLNDQLHGFYRSKFTDVNGNEQVVATTQFEATDARRAFPCWDEPDFKAVFGVTLVVPEDLMAVSNGAEISREPSDGGRVRVRFADTMVMSTYLVAFVVGPFEESATVDVDGVPLRVIAPKGKGDLTGFALDCGAFCLGYLRDYYGIEYPGDKVDMIAIPDFAFGAMENLGAITYRETALLVDDRQATQAELVRILDVIAHELAHMWFGDLVTMKWWDGIWLNEAFATFMEMKATDAMRPEWKRWLSFGAVERPWAFGTDSLASTRPVEFEVLSPDEAQEMFDSLTYGKGSSVLRMIEQFLGEEVFREGVGSYLRKHSYSNTVTADLWEGLDIASGVDVGSIMDTWILQRGYPQVEVTRIDGGIRVEQRRYLSIPDETDATSWKIPLVIRGVIAGNPFAERFVFEDDSMTIDLPGDPDFVVVNAGGHGFYRVAYHGELFDALVASLPHLDDLERYCLVDDTWAFVESGQKSADDWITLASSYRHESEQAIWNTLIAGMGAIRHHIVSDTDLPAFRALARELFGPVADRLGWESNPDETDLTRRLRGSILGAMGRIAEDAEVIDRSRELALRWLDDRGDVDPDVGQAALFTFAAHGDIDTFKVLIEAYRQTQTPQAKMKLLQSTTFLDGDDTVDAVLKAVKDGTIKSQDSAWVVARLFGGRRSGPHAWREVRSGWAAVTSTMPPMTLRRMIEGIPALSYPDVAEDVEEFFSETKLPSVEKTVRQNLERLRVNLSMRERESDRIGESLPD